MQQPDIKIFVSCHQNSFVPEHPLLYPIQVGTSLSDSEFPNMLHDNTGDHISEKNKRFCELTAQYWVWKNIEADYYGFFHYRRYLVPNPKTKKIYQLHSLPDEIFLDKCEFSQFESLIPNYDIIVPKSENMRIPVARHYAEANFHHKKDLDLMKSILIRQQPQYQSAMEQYLMQTSCYFGNIFIMKKEVFQDYCEWLYPVLFHIEQEIDMTEYGVEEQRVLGYLGERLLGIYYTQRKRHLRCLELPRMHFEGNSMVRWRKQWINLCLPVGSWRRAMVKGRILK